MQLQHVTETYCAASDDDTDDLDKACDDNDTGRVLTDDVIDIITRNTDKQWIDHSFIMPLRVVNETSSYLHLAVMFKILASLAVTSASAERVLSRVRIKKWTENINGR